MKYEAKLHLHNCFSRSREGAWIEIKIRFLCCGEYGVAPVRERGLKLQSLYSAIPSMRRSREGAWIEIDYDIEDISEEMSLP